MVRNISLQVMLLRYLWFIILSTDIIRSFECPFLDLEIYMLMMLLVGLV